MVTIKFFLRQSERHGDVQSNSFSDIIKDDEGWSRAGSRLSTLVLETDAWAVGECGLDSTIPVSMKAQEDCFVYQVVLSKVLKLPIIIHERQAFSRVMEVLTKYGERSMPIHWHCYTGPIEKASSNSNQFPNVKFGATLKLLNDPELQETFRQLPRTSILLESDYPY